MPGSKTRLSEKESYYFRWVWIWEQGGDSFEGETDFHKIMFYFGRGERGNYWIWNHAIEYSRKANSESQLATMTKDYCTFAMMSW